jgi:UDP:flavonoid glycosyltransferase YjiC (YdhE family)
MRVLISSVAANGHLQPLLPLAEAMRGAGHEVAVATGPDAVPLAGAAGFAAFSVGANVADWFVELGRRHPTRPWEGLSTGQILQFFMPRLFAEIGAAAALRDLIPLVETWRPDLIVYETFELAASLAGALAGVPTVHHTISPLPPAEASQLTRSAMAPLWMTHGLVPDSSRDLCLDICPPSLRNPAAEAPETVLPLRPVATTVQGAASPGWDTELPAGPLVHVTFGTQMQPEDDAVLMTLLEGLREEPVTLIVTVGPRNDSEELGRQPSNVRVVKYVPHGLLLPRCDAVVCHGGAGTMLAALSYGLPLLMVPLGSDQFINAELCRRRGVAHVLTARELSSAGARRSFRALLDDRSTDTAAREVAAEIAAMPSPSEVVRRLERLASPGAR